MGVEAVKAQQLFPAGAGMNRVIDGNAGGDGPVPRRRGGTLLTTMTIIATLLLSERGSDRVTGQLGRGISPTGHDGYAWRMRTTIDLGHVARPAGTFPGDGFGLPESGLIHR